MKRGKGSRAPSGFRLNLKEVAVAIGCNPRTIRAIVAYLGIQPIKVEKRRGIYSIGPADFKRIAVRYHVLADGPGRRTMTRRNSALNAAERLERWWLAQRRHKAVQLAKNRAKRRAARNQPKPHLGGPPASADSEKAVEGSLPAPLGPEVADFDGAALPAVGDGASEAHFVVAPDAAPAVAAGFPEGQNVTSSPASGSFNTK